MKKEVRRKKIIVLVSLIFICVVTSAFAVDSLAAGNTICRVAVPVKMYHPALDNGYKMENRVLKTLFGSSAYTSLSIETHGSISRSAYNGYTAFGIVGTDVELKLKINHNAAVNQYINRSSQWLLCNDAWGTYKEQTVNGVFVSKVNSGAIIVQTSTDGKNWSDENMAKYTNGLYTTDFYKNYGISETVIYRPDGEDVGRGLYIRVSYAYEIYDAVECNHLGGLTDPVQYWRKPLHQNHNQYENYLEVYSFYLFNDSPEAVTFKNLSKTEKVPIIMSAVDEGIIEAYRQCETLLSGSGTVSGFEINNSKNLGANIVVYKNGTKISIPDDKRFISTGKYNIDVTTQSGKVKRTTIYVDRASNEESLAEYFGPGFLSNGKRIFSEGKLPVFEGGKTMYSLCSVSNDKLPLSGTITNLTTGSVINIEATRRSKTGVLKEPGEYEAKFTTNPFFNIDQASGDARVFTFRFVIIEKGTAPGPVCNQKNLKDYATSSISDCYPAYFGITFPSAGKGYITLAFADYDSAVEYAVNYEKGIVERQSDGSFIYRGTLSLNGPKTEYNSTWDLTDAIYYFAKQAVTREYFDMSEQQTYLTLEDETLDYTRNLRTLELERSVVVFASEEHRIALLARSSLPVIHPKEHAYLTLDGTTEIEDGDFVFVRDKNGYDSHTISVTDSKGNHFSVEYNRGLGKQLSEMGCASGEITIKESTVYGDSVTYKALFVAKGVNTSEVTVDFMIGGEGKTIVISQKDKGTVLEANAFSLSSVVDSLDPYSIIKIVKDGKTQAQQICCIEEVDGLTFGEVGEYEITCVSRLGCSFSFSVIITSPCEGDEFIAFLTSKRNESEKTEKIESSLSGDHPMTEVAEEVDSDETRTSEFSSKDIVSLAALIGVIIIVIILLFALL